jgi:hypothetical protein
VQYSSIDGRDDDSMSAELPSRQRWRNVCIQSRRRGRYDDGGTALADLVSTNAINQIVSKRGKQKSSDGKSVNY